MFEYIHKLRKRSNEFVKKLNEHQAEAIDESKEELIKINQKQLQASTLADGKAITPLYSLAYAKKKGYSNPDLYDTGEMYRQMDVITDETKGSYFITSFAKHTKYLYRYGKIFGIAPKNLPVAANSTVERLKRLWYVLVVK